MRYPNRWKMNGHRTPIYLCAVWTALQFARSYIRLDGHEAVRVRGCRA
jgi:hypothetical protein